MRRLACLWLAWFSWLGTSSTVQAAEARLAACRRALDAARQLKPLLQRLDEDASRLQQSLAAGDPDAAEALEHIRQDRRDIETLVDALLAPEHTTG